MSFFVISKRRWKHLVSNYSYKSVVMRPPDIKFRSCTVVPIAKAAIMKVRSIEERNTRIRAVRTIFAMITW